LTTASPVIAATKLHIPAVRPHAVSRPDLIRTLEAGLGARLTLLCAPPGSGKTSLLSQWQAGCTAARFGWVSLDGADNDPVRFWDGVLAAVATVDAALGTRAQAALHAPGTTLADNVVPLLINDLDALGEPLVLVLDDYHEIENGEIHEAMALLLERLPTTAQLAISTRSDPPLPLGRLRVRGELTEIRADRLRFTHAEAAGFLEDVVGRRLDGVEIARLHERTEGWVAALQLVGLSLKGREDSHEFITSFAGDDRQIVDYLGYEVLDRQPPELRSFLIRSSILSRLSAPLCTAVTGAADADAVLRRLERENLFVIPLDSTRAWYRYHQLFAELLRHELIRTDPGLVAELHRRAAAWYRDEGAIHEAIEHATAAGAFSDAIELITTHWYEFLQRGRQETVAAWIDRLPADVIAADPDLCLTKAWLGVNTGRLDEVDRWIEAAALAAAERPAASDLPPLSAGVASLRAIHCYMDGNVGAAVLAGRHALALERGGAASPWRPVGCPVLGLSLHWHGRSDDATATLTEAVRIADTNGNHLAAMHASGGLAAIAHQHGDAEAAAGHVRHAGEVAARHGLDEHWARSLSLAVEAQLLERGGDVEAADRVLVRASDLAHRGVASIEIAYTLLTLAGLRGRRGDGESALRLRSEVAAVISRCADPGIMRERLARTAGPTRNGSGRAAASSGRAARTLTGAELSVLRLLPSELSQREISGELQLSLNTIKTHTRSIYRKLDVATRRDAVARAKALSLL
jgi:LuxR family maltose regulon positive regulatory protein